MECVFSGAEINNLNCSMPLVRCYDLKGQSRKLFCQCPNRSFYNGERCITCSEDNRITGYSPSCQTKGFRYNCNLTCCKSYVQSVEYEYDCF